MSDFRTYFIGRDPNNTVVMADESISRRHCEITVNGDDCVLVDSRSTHGCYIQRDGQWCAITHEYINVSDTIKLGRVSGLVSDFLRGDRA